MHFSTLSLLVAVSSAAFSFAAPVSPSNRASLAGAATSGVLSRSINPGILKARTNNDAQGAENVNTTPSNIKAIARQDLDVDVVDIEAYVDNLLNDADITIH